MTDYHFTYEENENIHEEHKCKDIMFCDEHRPEKDPITCENICGVCGLVLGFELENQFANVISDIHFKNIDPYETTDNELIEYITKPFSVDDHGISAYFDVSLPIPCTWDQIVAHGRQMGDLKAYLRFPAICGKIPVWDYKTWSTFRNFRSWCHKHKGKNVNRLYGIKLAMEYNGFDSDWMPVKVQHRVKSEIFVLWTEWIRSIGLTRYRYYRSGNTKPVYWKIFPSVPIRVCRYTHWEFEYHRSGWFVTEFEEDFGVTVNSDTISNIEDRLPPKYDIVRVWMSKNNVTFTIDTESIRNCLPDSTIHRIGYRL